VNAASLFDVINYDDDARRRLASTYGDARCRALSCVALRRRIRCERGFTRLVSMVGLPGRNNYRKLYAANTTVTVKDRKKYVHRMMELYGEPIKIKPLLVSKQIIRKRANKPVLSALSAMHMLHKHNYNILKFN